MAKRTSKKEDKPAPPPEPAPEPRDRVGTNLNVWLPDALMEAFESVRKKTRRTKTAEVRVMMEEYLVRLGAWTPDEDAE